ncbi:MAG: hypothetical protein M1823_000633 [Watsoniomyces obsoletus]|nr:MAG: hypothetical protein M1823_000633 [Watsoniomyces obsoletus]
MASVSALDKDLKQLRLSKYTPQAARETQAWIEDVLGERLNQGDLLEALKDGVVLCKLVNLAVPSPGVKYKTSNMPFVQRENIAHFLRAVQAPPLGLPDHDVFLTVDLYEGKDPAQVLQCLGAFSRRANAIQSSRFPRTLGPKGRPGTLSPQGTGTAVGWKSPGHAPRARGASSASQSSVSTSLTGTRSTADGSASGTGDTGSVTSGAGKTTPRGGISSWSRKSDEATTAPAWNIYQYGYMGGASQGNQGISFGATRQITSSTPAVTTWAEKERRRREEEERLRLEAEEARGKQLEREAEEERDRLAEEERWREETRKRREREQLEAEAEKARWEEQERKWKEDEERRLKEEREIQARLEAERRRNNKAGGVDPRPALKGQFLSEYLSEHDTAPSKGASVREETDIEREREKVRQLERELELAKAREAQYQAERRQHMQSSNDRGGQEETKKVDEINRSLSLEGTPPSAITRGGSRPDLPARENIKKETPNADERTFLQDEWQRHQATLSEYKSRPLPDPTSASFPTNTNTNSSNNPTSSPRPLPDPSTYTPPPNGTRVDRFLASNPAPISKVPSRHVSNELGFDSAAERYNEDTRREQSQSKTKAGGWASKSLLEREMERERQRQQEWEEAQKTTREAAARNGTGPSSSSSGSGSGSGGLGLGLGFTGRRQIIGPRPPP